MKAIIIDDESDARSILHALIKDFCPAITVVAEADDLEKGVAAIVKHKADLVFLDIEMPRFKGIHIRDFLPENTHDFQIIFVTAYQQYAIDAFRLAACDYLLKPIDIELLKTAVAKAGTSIERNFFKERYNLLTSIMQQKVEQICVHEKEQITIIQAEEIVYLKADSNYTEFHLLSGQVIIASKTLKEYEGLLKNSMFFKCHRSYIINTNMITSYIKGESLLLLKNEVQVPIARDKKDEFRNILGN